ncbi:MAG: GNAT family N-acetyltransferase, partial [Actinomycetota bacterium]|nr:GNAT family N-acetyltransferase [Actinomycetota bacterium]
LEAGELDAEVSFFVDDEFQGRGLGTLLLEYLAAAGRHQGIYGFDALVLPENYGMLRVFRRAGFDVRTGYEQGVIKVALGIRVTAEASAAIDARERAAQARSVARLLEPTSVAVIGAGRHPDSVGHRLAGSLVAAGFGGTVQVVSTNAVSVAGLVPVRSVTDLVAPVDLAVVCVPAADVLETTRACIELGVAGLLVISGGFSDLGPEGDDAQEALVDLVRRNGLRIVGPNAFGVVNTDPAIRLRALFMPVPVPAGEVGLLSQAGPLGAALLTAFQRAGTGISSFAALGNRADVSVNDLLQYWAADPRTTVIALYLENFGNFQKFTRIARSVSMTKPVVAVAPIEGDRGDLVRQSGVVVVSEVGELAAQARIAATQPVPTGGRVVIVSNASSVARLCVAACRRAGLEVVVPDVAADAEWARVGDAERLVGPGGSAQPDYERAVVTAAVSADVDVVMVALVPVPGLSSSTLASLLDRIDDAVAKPMVAVGLTGVALSEVARLPLFDFPEQAAAALGRWVEYGLWRARPRGAGLEVPGLDQVASALEALTAVPAPEHHTLSPLELVELLRSCGVAFAPTRSAHTSVEAVEAAEALGYPVVLKAGDPSHRFAGEAGGVALDVRDAQQLVAAFDRMVDVVPGFVPALVQRMMPTGRHLAIEARQDATRGARLTLTVRSDGAGAVPFRRVLLLPATDTDVGRLVDELSDIEQLDRNGADSLEELVARVAAAVGAFPSLARVELNPVLVSDDGAVAVDAVVEVRRFERDPLAEVRHL